MVDCIALEKALAKLEGPAVLAFGDPLLHTHVIVNNNDVINAHNLTVNDKIEIAEEKIQKLCVEVFNEWNHSQTAGGSAQNILRTLQWLGNTNKKISIYYGAVGNDTNGTLIQALTMEAGLDTRYTVHPDLPTGVCVSLVNETSPTTAVHLGAAGTYTLDDLKKNDLPLNTAKILYIENSFVIHSPAVAQELVKQAEEKNIIIVFNIEGLHLVQKHHAIICEMVACANIVFGSAEEMAAFAQILNIKYDHVLDIPFLLNSLKMITISVCNKTSDDWLRNGGIFIMSQGGFAPTVMVWGRHEHVEVNPIKYYNFLDKTGCRDALIAGFIAGVLAGWDPKHCLEFGCKVAAFMRTQIGVPTVKSISSSYAERNFTEFDICHIA